MLTIAVTPAGTAARMRRTGASRLRAILSRQPSSPSSAQRRPALPGRLAAKQVGAFVMALRMKGETADELAGFVEALESRMARPRAPEGALDVDAHGDGHQGRATLLPAAACAAAALGVPVLLRTEIESPW